MPLAARSWWPTPASSPSGRRSRRGTGGESAKAEAKTSTSHASTRVLGSTHLTHPSSATEAGASNGTRPINSLRNAVAHTLVIEQRRRPTEYKGEYIFSFQGCVSSPRAKPGDGLH